MRSIILLILLLLAISDTFVFNHIRSFFPAVVHLVLYPFAAAVAVTLLTFRLPISITLLVILLFLPPTVAQWLFFAEDKSSMYYFEFTSTVRVLTASAAFALIVGLRHWTRRNVGKP